MFMDETTNDSMEKAEFLLDITSSLPFKIKWGGYARIDLFYSNPEMASIMLETGLAHTFFGIETFNKKSGSAVGKGLDPDKVKQTLISLREIWKSDVRITSGLMIGLPHETKQTLKDLENYLLSDECALDSWVLFPLMLSHNTLFGQDPVKYGYHVTDEDKANGFQFNWRNNDMNLIEAIQIANEIKVNTNHCCKITQGSHSRLQNLGFSEQEVDSWTMNSYIDNMPIIRHKLLERKDNYFKHLMSL
jgi:coproporphyrinogen III oxidase-like Fe-S oxidoreductase